MPSRPQITFTTSALGVEDIVALAEGRAEAVLDERAEFVGYIDRGALFLDQLLREDGVIYGVTTGYGDSCTVAVPGSLVSQLPKALYTFHGVGQGELLTRQEVRAVLAVRLGTLAKGRSGVSYALLTQLLALLRHDVLPAIPAEGSVGASGDLTPMSYVAAVLSGEREVLTAGSPEPAAQALAARGLTPLVLRVKEALAVMNGTTVMTALACLAFQRAEYLCRLSTRITALVVVALAGNPDHFDEFLFSVKPHPGPQRVAARLRLDLGVVPEQTRNRGRLQDRYSLRCAPHVLGVLEDALPFLRSLIENELNGSDDNPIIDAEAGRVLHGGHFYGGHIAFAMDSLKNVVANVADLLDRQLAQLLDPKFSNGLPANLSGATAARASINHGLKALGIATSAWTAEALKLTMPASVFSRSTECHNQDKVSLGTIAARDCLRVLTLTEQVAAGTLLAAAQGLELRRASDDQPVTAWLLDMLSELRKETAFVGEDRRLDRDLTALALQIRARAWPLYESELR